MNLGRLSKGQGIAGLSAILLFVAMFLDWYRFEQGGNLLVLVELFVMSGSAWETLGAIPFVLALTIAITVGACLLAAGSSRWNPALPPSAWVAVLGAISFVLILYRIVFPPGLEEFSPGIPFYARPELGIYLALLAAVGIAFGGCLAMYEDGRLRFDVRRLRPDEIVK
jgi:hypothetical protein